MDPTAATTFFKIKSTCVSNKFRYCFWLDYITGDLLLRNMLIEHVSQKVCIVDVVPAKRIGDLVNVRTGKGRPNVIEFGVARKVANFRREGGARQGQ